MKRDGKLVLYLPLVLLVVFCLRIEYSIWTGYPLPWKTHEFADAIPVPPSGMEQYVSPQDYEAKWNFVLHPKHLVVFGDSLSSEGWDWKREVNPLDEHPIVTRCDGPVWARNLTRRYGWAGHTKLINLAVPGATISNEHTPVVPLDFLGQIRVFFEYFGNAMGVKKRSRPTPRAAKGWAADNTVFAIAFGTNDVLRALEQHRAAKTLSGLEMTYRRIAASYSGALSRLHAGGARAFAFAPALPVHRTPGANDLTPEERTQLATAAEQLNNAVMAAAFRWCGEHANEVFCTIVDINDLAKRVTDDPVKYGFKYPSTYCEAYASRTNSEPDNNKDPQCNGRPRDYVWRDDIHPTWAFHELWADLYESQAGFQLRSYRQSFHERPPSQDS